MVSVDSILDMVPALGVVIALVYYSLTIRVQTKSRQTQTFMQLHEVKYDQEGLETFFKLQNREWNDFDEYMEKYGPYTHPEETAMYESQVSYMEGLGILVQENMVDSDIVNKLAGRRILQTWQKFEQIIREVRLMEPGPGPDYCESFEFLANEIIKIRKKEGLTLYEDRLHPSSTQYQERT